MKRTLHFDAAYEEWATLADGTRVVLRLVQPSDKSLLLHGFREMSPESRYRRFLSARGQLSEADLRYFTEVDQRDHFAIGAAAPHPELGEEGLGVARFVRLSGEPAVAEPAIAVVDRMQGKGLGRLLFMRLVAAAAERDVARFRFDILADNEGMRALALDIAPDATFREDGDIVEVELPLPTVEPARSTEAPELGSALYRIFRKTARGLLNIRPRATRTGGPAGDEEPT